MAVDFRIVGRVVPVQALGTEGILGPLLRAPLGSFLRVRRTLVLVLLVLVLGHCGLLSIRYTHSSTLTVWTQVPGRTFPRSPWPMSRGPRASVPQVAPSTKPPGSLACCPPSARSCGA